MLSHFPSVPHFFFLVKAWGTYLMGECSVLLHNGVNLSNMFGLAQNEANSGFCYGKRKRFQIDNIFLSYLFCIPSIEFNKSLATVLGAVAHFPSRHAVDCKFHDHQIFVLFLFLNLFNTQMRKAAITFCPILISSVV